MGESEKSLTIRAPILCEPWRPLVAPIGNAVRDFGRGMLLPNRKLLRLSQDAAVRQESPPPLFESFVRETLDFQVSKSLTTLPVGSRKLSARMNTGTR
jgi:hypothetical protein